MPVLDNPSEIIEVNRIHDGADEIKIKRQGKRTITRFRDKSTDDDEGLLSRQEARRRGITLSTLPQPAEDNPAPKKPRNKKK